MKIAIRVDASSKIGTGHFMRCLTLANELKARGVHTRFICRHLPEILHQMLLVNKHEFMHLDSVADNSIYKDLAHDEWLGTTQHADAQDSIKFLLGHTWDWLVVDHYALDASWESELRQVANKILVIDDLADRLHECDLLLDQNFYSDMYTRYTNKVPSHCNLLLGPQYALLRGEFRKFRKKIKPRTGTAKRLLVFFGGVDLDNFTGYIIEILHTMVINHVDVVIGDQHPNRDQIVLSCEIYGFTCHVQTSRMAELMALADFSIGAGGSATWERCCLGLPTLVVSLADNQTDIAKDLNLLGAGEYLGTQNDADLATIYKAVNEWLINKNKIQMYSKKAYSIVDGQGVDRLCDKLIS